MKYISTRKNFMCAMLATSLLTLTSCIPILKTSKFKHKNGTSVIIRTSSPYNMVIIKNDSLLHKDCLPSKVEKRKGTYFYGMSCGFKEKIPDSIQFNYYIMSSDEAEKKYYGKQIMYAQRKTDIYDYFDTNGKKVSLKEWLDKGDKKLHQAIMSLPNSAWKTYTVDIKSIMQKYKGVTPSGSPMIGVIPIGLGGLVGSPFKAIHKRRLNLEINFENGEVSEVKENYDWEAGSVSSFTY